MFLRQAEKAGSVLGSWVQPGKLGANDTRPHMWSAGTWREPGACQIAGKRGKTEPLPYPVQWEEVNELQSGFPPPVTLAQVQFSALD